MKSNHTKSRVAQQPKNRAGAAGTSASGAASAPASAASSTTTLAESILRAIQTVNRARGPDEPRQATRHHYCVPMTLHIDDPRARTTRTIRAASSNISTGGFAFIFDAALTPGSTIRAQFESLPGKPEIGGLVRSCVHICGTQHRIGVEYQ